MHACAHCDHGLLVHMHLYKLLWPIELLLSCFEAQLRKLNRSQKKILQIIMPIAHDLPRVCVFVIIVIFIVVISYPPPPLPFKLIPSKCG